MGLIRFALAAFSVLGALALLLAPLFTRAARRIDAGVRRSP